MNRLIKLLFVEKTVRQFWGPAAFLLLLFLGTGVVCFYFKNDIVNQQEYVVKRENIRVDAPPSWITGEFVTETLQLLPAEYRDEALIANQGRDSDDDASAPDETKLRLNANDPRLVENLRVAALKHPLVESVRKIVVRYPATVTLYLDFRVPIAIVDPSPEFREEFRDDVRKFFPEDVKRDDELNESSASSTTDDADGKEVDVVQYSRYLVDRLGKPLPTKYFEDHPDAFHNLPRVAGITTTTAGANADPLLEEAGAFARFLDETNVTEDWQIVRLGVLRERDSRHGTWFFKTTGGSIVKWGRFSRKKRKDAAPSYAPNSRSVDSRDAWADLYNFQFQKFDELRRRILDNAALVAMRARSDDPETRKNAEKSRLKVYDVSDVLRDEEEGSETSGVEAPSSVPASETIAN